jgi:hypothetical protein
MGIYSVIFLVLVISVVAVLIIVAKNNLRKKHDVKPQLLCSPPKAIEEALEKSDESAQKAQETEPAEIESETRTEKPVSSVKEKPGTEGGDVGKSPLPQRRGGRPRSPEKREVKKRNNEAEPRSQRPDIVCQKEGRNWTIGVEMPENLKATITQNGEVLKTDKIDEPLYRLMSIKGKVSISLDGEDKDIELMREERDYLIFRTRKNWGGLGRLVRYATAGYYLIVVPEKWKRDEAVSSCKPVVPEKVHLNGYIVHYFYRAPEENTAIGFITENGERIKIASGMPRFQLIGNKIDDASEEMGPLFGEEPPSIQALDEKGWTDVVFCKD